MTRRCQFCERPIRWPGDEGVCLGEHSDRDQDPVTLHIHCPCPVHNFEADRRYCAPEHRTSGTSDADREDADGTTVDELLEEVVAEHPELAEEDDE